MAKKSEKTPKKTENCVDLKAKMDFAKYVATHLQGQVDFADKKAAWTFSVLAVGTGALINKLLKIDWAATDSLKVLPLLGIAFFFIILAFIQIAKVVYPRIGRGHKGGYAYFEDIVQENKREYVKEGTSLTDERMLKVLYEEAYDLASIASRKFKEVYKAIVFSTIALIITIIVLLLT